MIPDFEHHRFDLSYFLNTCADEAGSSCAASSSSDSKTARVHQKAFQDLVEMFSINIQKHLKDAGWRRVLQHKSVALLFLDKINSLYPNSHPIAKIAGRYGYNSPTVASLEVLYYLSAILKYSDLEEESKQIIQKWMIGEISSLSYILFFDGVREMDAGIMEGLRQGRMNGMDSREIEIKEEHLDTMVKDLSEQVRALPNGESVKFLGGTNLHEVRIVITKNPDDELFTIASFDAAEKETTAVKRVTKEKAASQEFLRALVKAKFSTVTDEVERVKDLTDQILLLSEGNTVIFDMGGKGAHALRLAITRSDGDLLTIASYNSNEEGATMVKSIVKEADFLKTLYKAKSSSCTESVLKKLDGYSVKTEKNPKAVQRSNSCSFFSILKEFKSFFLSSYSKDAADGHLQYKLIKSLMTDYAVFSEQGQIDEELYRALVQKSAVRSRFFELSECIRDPKRVSHVLDFYEKAFAIVDPGYDVAAVRESPTMKSVMRMDKRLSQLSDPISMSPEDWRKLKTIYDMYVDSVPARVLSNWGVRQQAAETVIERSLDFVRPLFGTNGALRFLPKSAQSFVLKRLGGDHLRGQQLVNFLLNEINDLEDMYPRIKECVRLGLLNGDDIFVLIKVKSAFFALDKCRLKAFLKELKVQRLVSFDGFQESILREIIDSSMESSAHVFLGPLLDKGVLSERSLFIKIQEAYANGYSLYIIAGSMKQRIKQDGFDKEVFIETIKFLLEKEQMDEVYFLMIVDELRRNGKIDDEEKQSLIDFVNQ